MIELVAGANTPLPGAAVAVRLDGGYDLSALVLGSGGKVGGDGDFVFYNAPRAPGVSVAPGRVEVTPARLRAGAERVVVVASPDGPSGAGPRATLAGPDGRPFARLPALGPEAALLLAEIYPRAGAWRVRAIGQGYSDGLAGLARDFGVQVDDDGTGTPAGPGAGASRGDPPVDEVVAATNAERARHGLGGLAVDVRLTRAAHAHTADMVRRGFFAHENPDGAQVWDRAVAAGYPYRKVAENIAAGQRTAAEVVRGWMDSPGHRANILDGELTQIGVGRVEGGEYGVYWTQVFGTPR
ncbi:CAP domain-containing protein [Pseudonocardia sp.]|uniref:CAP domain-containing protein n=1 Tax=Pseudonocardia sp. TaxID=60912 RepID=UPI002608B0F1|nr:CAP domain-containing protein [Pseudonocardia sp.]